MNHLRLQLEHEVRLVEQLADVIADVGCGKGIVSFSGASQTERAIEHEEAAQRQFCWMSQDSDAWNRNPRSYSGRIASDVSLCGIGVWLGRRDLDGE